MRSAGLNTPTGNWCDKCRRGGHVKEECWSKENSNTQGSTGNFREKKIRCYNCREEGHTRKICPKRKSGVILCKEKNKPVHNVRLYRCRIVEGRYTEDILLDTGCEGT